MTELDQTPAGASTPPAQAAAPAGLDRIAAAFDRAENKLAAKKGDAVATPQDSKDAGAPAGEQAAVGEKPVGASAPAAAPVATTGKPEATAGEGEAAKGGQKPATPEAVSAPQDWSAQDRAAFEALPGDEARTLVLSQYQRMQGAFTQAMQHVADLRAVGETMNRAGISRDEVMDLLETARAFAADPRATLQKLADSKQLPVWFERPGEEDEPPADALADPKAFARWVSERATVAARRERESADREASKVRETEVGRERLREAFVATAREHPDFAEHKDRVVELLAVNSGRKTPEDAYRLATYEGLTKLAREGETAKRYLATTKAQLEKLQAGMTRPPPGPSSGKPDPREALMDPVERAYQKAQRKLAAARQ